METFLVQSVEEPVHCNQLINDVRVRRGQHRLGGHEAQNQGLEIGDGENRVSLLATTGGGEVQADGGKADNFPLLLTSPRLFSDCSFLLNPSTSLKISTSRSWSPGALLGLESRYGPGAEENTEPSREVMFCFVVSLLSFSCTATKENEL